LWSALSFKKHHRQCQQPGRNLRDDDEGKDRQEQSGDDHGGRERWWFPGQVVVDVVGPDQQPVDSTACCQKWHRDQEEPDHRGTRQVDEVDRSPIRVDQGVEPGHAPVLDGTKPDHHELPGLGEKNAQ